MRHYRSGKLRKCTKTVNFEVEISKKMNFFKNSTNHSRMFVMTSDHFPGVFWVSESPPDLTDATFRRLKFFWKLTFGPQKSIFPPFPIFGKLQSVNLCVKKFSFPKLILIQSSSDFISKLRDHFWEDLSSGFSIKGLDLKIHAFLQQ